MPSNLAVNMCMYMLQVLQRGLLFVQRAWGMVVGCRSAIAGMARPYMRLLVRQWRCATHIL